MKTLRRATTRGIGIRALAVHFPQTVRTNSYLRERNPHLVEDAERKTLSRVFSQQDTALKIDTYEQEMAPFLADPFRGSVERRALAPGETALSLEVQAANSALAAAALTPDDIDLMLVCSFLPDQIGPGNAAFLARELNLNAPAWNVESTCSSALVLQQ